MTPFRSRFAPAALCVLATLSFQLSPVLAQGSLTPPPGPIAPVMKSLDQVEPRSPVNTLPGDATAAHIIKLPGSYYFSGPISGQGGKAGIRIEAVNVTVDLNGFNLEAAGGSTKGIHVISSGGPIVIRNGQLRFWPGHAIHIENVSEFVLEDLVITSTQGNGIRAQGSGTIERVTVNGANTYGIYCSSEGQTAIRECRVENVTGNVAMGIYAFRCLVSNCTVANVTGDNDDLYTYPVTGIHAYEGAVESCTVRKIIQNGVTGVGIERATRVSDCTVAEVVAKRSDFNFYTTAYGIRDCGTVTGCTVRDIDGLNGVRGIIGTQVSQCLVSTLKTASGFGIGIYAGQVLDSQVSTLPSGSRGIQVNGLAARNQLYGTGTGILASYGALITGNVINFCDGDGISASPGATVTDNTVVGALNTQVGKAGTGIRAGNEARVQIERNHVSGWTTGIQASAASALVRANTAGGNTVNFSLHASMPVVTTATLGTNPNANVSQ